MAVKLDLFTNSLDRMRNLIATILAVPVDNAKYQYFAWTLKVIAQIIESVFAAIFLGTEIVQNLRDIDDLSLLRQHSSNNNFANREGYRDAANVFIVLFNLEITWNIVLWAVLFVRGPQKYSAAASALFAIVFEATLVMCGLYLLKAKGNIDLEKQTLCMIFQIWFFVNIILQIVTGYAEKVAKKVHYLAVIFIIPLAYIIACLAYAFVIIPIAGWNMFRSFSDIIEYSYRDFVHETFNSTHTPNIFEFLILSGLMGQWIWTVIFVGCLICLSLVTIVNRCRRYFSLKSGTDFQAFKNNFI